MNEARRIPVSDLEGTTHPVNAPSGDDRGGNAPIHADCPATMRHGHGKGKHACGTGASVPAPRPWFLQLDADGRRPAPAAIVFAFHFAGGSVNSLRPLREVLDPSISLHLASLPGRALRFAEPPCRDLRHMVQALADALIVRAVAPYVLYGHSMGALLGFEVARELRRRGVPLPQALVVSGARAPQHYGRLPQDYSFNLPRDAFMHFLRGLEGTPAEFFEHPELVDMMLPVLRADFEVCETYRHQPEAPFDFPLIALHGAEDGLVGPDAMHPWGIHTNARFVHRELSGGHFFINRHWAEIADVLARRFPRS